MFTENPIFSVPVMSSWSKSRWISKITILKHVWIFRESFSYKTIVVHGWKIDSRKSPEPPGSSQSPKTNLQNFENSEHSKIWVWWAAGGFVIKFVFFVCFFQRCFVSWCREKVQEGLYIPRERFCNQGINMKFLNFWFPKIDMSESHLWVSITWRGGKEVHPSSPIN